ncbi:MAG: ATP-binding cassette domain-containing protein [Firmicutes bacterium]|nr:ATP-binding cassette domain-containing protein [Bacillota bacterium]
MNQRAAVEAEKLSKSFGDNWAVDGIDLTINEGEIFGLVGPNGAGKTTTIRMLTTILPQTSGEARVFGHNVRKRPERVRKLIGYVPQALSADGDLTGFENLLVFAKLVGIPRSSRREKINQVLSRMGLEEAADKRVRYYSGGMVRRLEIGQAMLIQPRILFLDEPTIGLDPVARGTVWELLGGLSRETSLTILLTTHYMEEAEALCGRVAIMNHGRLAVVGTPDELKAATGKAGATLEDAFRFFTGGDYEREGNFRELKRTRRLARRLG